MALKNIIGQEKAVSMLQGALARKRISSAYLFAGESGIGKKAAAVNFAKAINCQNSRNTAYRLGNGSKEPDVSLITHHSPINDFDACDQCDSCRKFDAGFHPDFFVISPDNGQIKIGQIRKTEGKGGSDSNNEPFNPLEEFLKFSIFEALWRFILIEDADRLNDQASNALLKTLEEPPANTIIILISSRPDRLGSTIRSRCSRVNFGTLSRADCRSVIAEKTDPAVADTVIRLSMGQPGLALTTDLIEDRDWFMNLLQAMIRAEKDSWASREEIEKWFDLAMIFIRDLTIFKITGRTSCLINADLTETISNMGKSADIQRIIDLYKEMSFIKTMLLFNLNKSLTWNYTASLLRKELYPQNV